LAKNLVALPAGFPGATPQGRVSLPLLGDAPALLGAGPDGTATTLLMAFDGKTVFLGRDFPSPVSLEKGRVYLVNVHGLARVEPPAERLTWTDYQSWVDRLRAEIGRASWRER